MEIGNINEKELLGYIKKSYETGMVEFEIQAKKSVLLVIDMQNEFVKPHWTPFWVPEATRIVPKIKKLIDFSRNKKIPIIYTVYSKTHQYLDRPRNISKMPCRFPDLNKDQTDFFIDGMVWHEIAPKDEEIIIHKPSYGAFYDTPLETILKNLEKDTVIICGTLTNYCCSTTARQAFERGFKVVFGSDTTAAHFNYLQEVELQVIRRGFAKVLTYDEIVESLQ